MSSNLTARTKGDMMGTYKNAHGMQVHIPFGNIDGGNAFWNDGTITIDFYGDGSRVESWEIHPNHYTKVIDEAKKWLTNPL